MNKMTILEATKKWVGEFNAIRQSLISRLVGYEMENWIELTKVKVGDNIYVYGLAQNIENGEYEMVQGHHEVEAIDDGIVTFVVDGVKFELEESEYDVERDDILPMWGTMWSFGEMLDDEWVLENLETMSSCGFRIYQDLETDDIYFGIDGAGYDFYEAHWIPLYKARGLKWHSATEEEALKAILIEIEQDEHEYCFDKNYCCDESWREQHGEKTRQEGFDESMAWHRTLTLDEILENYGDKYDYILEEIGYTKN